MELNSTLQKPSFFSKGFSVKRVLKTIAISIPVLFFLILPGFFYLNSTFGENCMIDYITSDTGSGGMFLLVMNEKYWNIPTKELFEKNLLKKRGIDGDYDMHIQANDFTESFNQRLLGISYGCLPNYFEDKVPLKDRITLSSVHFIQCTTTKIFYSILPMPSSGGDCGRFEKSRDIRKQLGAKWFCRNS